MVEDPPDPLNMPMDISLFLAKLYPPPEELIHSCESQEICCPIFVPPKHVQELQSEPFKFCGVQVYLIEPELGISEDGQTTEAMAPKSRVAIEVDSPSKVNIEVEIHGEEHGHKGQRPRHRAQYRIPQ